MNITRDKKYGYSTSTQNHGPIAGIINNREQSLVTSGSMARGRELGTLIHILLLRRWGWRAPFSIKKLIKALTVRMLIWTVEAFRPRYCSCSMKAFQILSGDLINKHLASLLDKKASMAVCFLIVSRLLQKLPHGQWQLQCLFIATYLTKL